MERMQFEDDEEDRKKNETELRIEEGHEAINNKNSGLLHLKWTAFIENCAVKFTVELFNAA